MKIRLMYSFLFLLSGGLNTFSQLPYLDKSENSIKLIVDGEPYIMLGGELHNSTSSSEQYMQDVWADMATINLNTVIATVSWELIEPVEDQFDFSIVDAIIEGARNEDLKLVLIWFGSFKNPWMTYAPSWVKANPERFPRAQNAKGDDLEHPSMFGKNVLKADARAYTELMKHIKETDLDYTVLMMQIGNEPGLRGAARDYSAAAEKAWKSDVPEQLISYMEANKNTLQPDLYQAWTENGINTDGSWEEVFGKSVTEDDGSSNIINFTEHVFTAYSYALYLDLLSSEGKKVLPIPTFTNAAFFGINSGGRSIGNGCAIPEFFDLYRAGAPSLDILTPNSYKLELDEICQAYAWKDNPILIPESRAIAARPLYAIGEWDALCFSPFAIDDIDPAYLTAEQSLYADTYAMMRNMYGLLTSNLGSEKMRGVFIYPGKEVETLEMGNYKFTISPRKGFDIGAVMGKAAQQAERNRKGDPTVEGEEDHQAPDPPPNLFGASGQSEEATMGGAIIIQISADEFYLVGYGINADISVKDDIPIRFCGYDAIWEGTFENDSFIPGRLLNGDERSVYLNNSAIGALKVKMYYY